MKPIEISHLYKAYDGKPVLTDFSATLMPGTVTALMAPSGGGKTTLLRILMGLERQDQGEISGLAGLRISAVFQEDRLCRGLSGADNIRLVNPELTREQVQQAMAAVGLTGDDKPVRAYSGGMSRRIAILRALLSPYDLLLLDEPFRGLDEKTKEVVMADTRRRCQGKTVLLVTHDKSELTAMGITQCLHF